MAVIVFDFDGVIVDSNAIKRDAYFKVLEGIVPDREIEMALEANPVGTRTVVIRNALRAIGLHDDQDYLGELVRKYGGLTINGVAQCDEIEGAIPYLIKRRQINPVYLNSATELKSLLSILDKRQIAWIFKGVYGSPKTKVENFQEIAKVEGCDRKHIIFIGDSLSDLSAAKEYGCSFIGFENGDSTFGEICQFPKARNFLDLARLIEREVANFSG